MIGLNPESMKSLKLWPPPRWLSFLGLNIVAVPLVALLLGSVNLGRLTNFAAHGIPTMGAVDTLTCLDHGTVSYHYAFHDSVFSGLAQPETNCIGLHAGDQIVVWYLPEQPQISMLRNPAEALGSERSSVPNASFFITAIGFMLAYFGLEHFLRRQ